MLCSKTFFTWTHTHTFINMNSGGMKASTSPICLWVKNQDYSWGRFSAVPESFNCRKTWFSWRWPQFQLVHEFSSLPPSQKSKHSQVEATGTFSWGRSAKGRRKLWGYDEGILFLWFDEKGRRGLCPAWFRLCWRAHWRLFEEASFREEGKKSQDLVFLPSPPTFLPDLTFIPAE